MANIITEMFIAKVEIKTTKRRKSGDRVFVGTNEIEIPTPDYAYDLAEMILRLQQPKDNYFWDDDYYKKLQPIIEREQKKISQGLSYNRYFKIYEEDKNNAHLTIWLKRVEL